MEKELYGEVQLAGLDAKHDPKMREGLGEWICTKAMARGNVESGKGLFQKL